MYPEIINYSEASRRLHRKGIKASRNTISEIVAARKIAVFPLFPGSTYVGLDEEGFRAVEETLTTACASA